MPPPVPCFREPKRHHPDAEPRSSSLYNPPPLSLSLSLSTQHTHARTRVDKAILRGALALRGARFLSCLHEIEVSVGIMLPGLRSSSTSASPFRRADINFRDATNLA